MQHLLTEIQQYVRPRGTVVCIGLPAGAYLRAPVFESVIKMVTIKGSYVGNVCFNPPINLLTVC